ncbi:cation diffusion facilitator family transporter [Methylocella sp.]|uniref:cation diffusion facilitator family transporter n=1 Tax=Methylocella sp. TaxID=1978226 RepID=UPI003784CBDF
MAADDHDAHGHDHDHDHDHVHAPGHAPGHAHAHGHAHVPTDFGPRFILGIALNAGFVGVEVVAGLLSDSVALLADAGHNLSDVLGLVVAYGATRLAARPPSGRFTYGLKGSSILAALFNAMFLLVAVGALSYEAVRRFFDPAPVEAGVVAAVAAVGVAINLATAMLFYSGRSDLNIRGAFLHMAADAAVSVGVGVAGLAILLTGRMWLDPLTSLLVNAVIVAGTWSLLRESVCMSLSAAPEGVDLKALRAWLAARPGVASLHDLHVWPVSTSETAMTAHLLMPAGHPGDAFLTATAAELERRFGVGHATLQIETDPATVCALAPDEVV